MQCERLTGCPFYQQKMPIDSGLGSMFRKNYCETDKNKCARYKVATTVGPQSVPIDLYPNMTTKAEQIIAEMTAKK